MGAVMTSRQAAELDFALERNGYTSADVKKLSGGDILAHLLPIVRAYGDAVPMVAVAYNFLSPRAKVALPVCAAFNPKSFYKTRTGLYVWGSFTDRILPTAPILKSSQATIIASFDLVKQANDTEIRVELRKNYVWEDASIFCAHLAGMINRQPNGKDGDLISNRYANIFYVRGVNSEVFTVSVDWDSGGREWDVYAHPLDDTRWNAGSRAFSSNC